MINIIYKACPRSFNKAKRLLVMNRAHYNAPAGTDSWESIECSKDELCIDITLACGQAFRWHKSSVGIWHGVFAGHVWKLKQTESKLLYQAFSKQKTTLAADCHENTTTDAKGAGRRKKESCGKNDDKLASQSKRMVNEATVNVAVDCKALLRDYFRLSVNLQELHDDWCSKDVLLSAKIKRLKGVRQLRQDPVETLFTFICSSNNNICRIGGMVERMCQKYGELIIKLDEETYYDFPQLEVLAGDDVETGLRDLGFGYRAAYISRTARYILCNRSANFLHELRSWPYENAKDELMKLHGVGAKVADCVCLMSLDKLNAVPVDTHVWQLAVRDYELTRVSANKSLTDAIYKQIGDFFRNLWGPYAGWAQSVAFTAELKKFQQYCQLPQQPAVSNKRRVKPPQDSTNDGPFEKKNKLDDS